MANYAHDVCAESHIFRGVLMKPPALLPYGRLPGAERTATISRIALPIGAVERTRTSAVLLIGSISPHPRHRAWEVPVPRRPLLVRICPRSASETLGFIKPELPTLVPEPPTGAGWIHEIKHDGYRTLIVIDRGQVRAFTRNGNDWTRAYTRVVEACGKLACKTAVIDGEMVVQDEHGITDFNALRSAIYTAPHRLVFFAFDLLHLDGQDLRGQPLMERRALLRKLIKPDTRSPIQFSDHVEGDGARFFKAAAELGLEGIVSKRAASRYRSGRSRSWLKTKNMVESEFVLLGTDQTQTACPGRCWHRTGMVGLSLPARPS